VADPIGLKEIPWRLYRAGLANGIGYGGGLARFGYNQFDAAYAYLTGSGLYLSGALSYDPYTGAFSVDAAKLADYYGNKAAFDAAHAAIVALSSSSECAGLFEQHGISNPGYQLAQYIAEGGGDFNIVGTALGGTPTGVAAFVDLGTRSINITAYPQPDVPGVGNASLFGRGPVDFNHVLVGPSIAAAGMNAVVMSRENYNAAVIIHEFFHVKGIIGPDALFSPVPIGNFNVGGVPVDIHVSADITAAVHAACF
jgi:hypothetical protein